MVRRRNRNKPALIANGVDRVKKHPVWSALIAGGLSTGLGFAIDAAVRRVRERRAATTELPEPQVGRLRFRFKNPVLDAHFSYVLAFQTRAGGDIGESFYAASRVGERDPESWVGEFTELAGRVADLADVALERGHWISARQTYLRASLYDRMALFALSPVDHPKRYRKILQQARSRFQKAAALFDPPVEVIEVPFEGKTLPGYFIRADDTGQKRPTILVIGGGESVVEDMCFLAGLGDNERGYNFLTVDLPGQGATPFDGFVVGPDAEVPMAAVVDYALSRPEVDPERLAAWGGSLGGYLVPRAATHEKRLKAIVANSMILDLHAYITQAPEITVLARLEGMPGFPLLSRAVGGRWAAGALTIMDTWKWRWGVSSLTEWLEAAREYVLDPADITCPTLLQVGEDEYAYPASRRFQEEALEKVSHSTKDLVLGRIELGAAGKNMLPNINLIRQSMFDWLDEVL